MKLVCFSAFTLFLTGCVPFLPMSGDRARHSVTIAAPSGSATDQLRIRIPARGADAPVRQVAQNGDAKTYMAVDNISVSYRQGVLVATRGLGADLMAGDADATLAALEAPENGVYSRQMRYLTSLHKSTWIKAGCEMKRGGAETRAGQQLTRYEESCIARRDRFTNIYWLNASGQILASRQWVSAAVGDLQTDPIAPGILR